MMNPRAYSLSSTPYRHSQSENRNGNSGAAVSVGTRPVQSKPSSKRNPISRPPTMTSISPAAPSKPVVIPTRTKSDRRHSKTHVQCDESVEDRSVSHNEQARSPSVAAFFAIKSLRDAKGRSTAGIYSGRPSKSIKNYSAEATDIESNTTSSSASSPRSWRLLLSPPEDTEDEDSTVESEDTAYGPLRSLSSESMPSLETDTESMYTSSSPSTPGFPRRGSGLREKRSKSISSSVPEDCLSDHPLRVDHSDHGCVAETRPEDLAPNEIGLPPPNKLSLRSNLTASLRRLKYAARNMTASRTNGTSRDDVQAQATLSEASRFADERRPLPWSEPPDPALRRYLNPFTISPAELHSHRDHGEGRTNSRACTASIQMQTYQPGARKSEKATAPPVFVVASPQKTSVDEPAVSTTQRHREPRENSDFLRVIVLEMNMRKVGKLSDVAPGRARLWLPARRSPTMDRDTSSDIPRRWTSLSA